MFDHRHNRSSALGIIVVVPLVVIASASATLAVSAATAPSAVARSTSAVGCGSPPRFVRQSFPPSPAVNNTYLPWVPGTQYVLQGSVGGGSHRVVTTVTDLTKVIDGVRTIVIMDQDIQGNQVQESEIFFNAQDKQGAVWNLGEYPEQYQNGKLAGAPDTWITNVMHAKPGFGMLAEPQVGTPGYLQGYVKSIGFDDCAKVLATGQRACVAVQCYDNVLVTDEWAPNDPAGGHQRKFYAPGVGTIMVQPVGGTAPETLQLISVTKLCGSAMDAARKAALKQDNRGYSVSPKVYGHTPRAQHTLQAAC